MRNANIIYLLLLLQLGSFAAQIGGAGSSNGEISTGTIEVRGTDAIKFPDGSLKKGAPYYYKQVYEGGKISLANSASYADVSSTDTRFTFTPPRAGYYEVTYRVPVYMGYSAQIDKTIVMQLNDGANGTGEAGDSSGCGISVRKPSYAQSHMDHVTLTLRKYFSAAPQTIFLRYFTVGCYSGEIGTVQYIFCEPSMALLIKEVRGL